MFISIIIPTRNRFDYVTVLLEDLLKQDVSNFELIVVDQSDDPKPIAHCQHIITTTKGPCVSRNIGAQAAKGDILVFLDDDARVNPDFIREISTPIITNRFDAVAGSICNPDGEYLREEKDFLKVRNENFIKVLTNNPDSQTSRISLAFPGCCAAILKSVYIAVGGFDETLDPTGAGEDRDMALKLYQHGYAIWYNANAKLLHAVAPFGGSRDMGSRTMMLDVHTYKMCQKYFSQELSTSLKESILRRYRINFYKSFIKLRAVRTKYRSWQRIRQLLK